RSWRDTDIRVGAAAAAAPTKIRAGGGFAAPGGGPPLPRSDLLADERVELLREDVLRDDADHLVHGAAVLEEDERRDRADPVLHGHLGVVVHVELADPGLPVVLAGDLLDGRRDDAAGPAPGGPEVHEDGLVALEHFLLKVGVGEDDVLRVVGHDTGGLGERMRWG